MKKTMAGLGQVVLMKKGEYSWEIAKAPSVLTLVNSPMPYYFWKWINKSTFPGFIFHIENWDKP